MQATVVAVAVAFAASVAVAGVGPSCPALGDATLEIPQVVPSAPGLNRNYTWRFALCNPSRDGACPAGVPAAYIFQSKRQPDGSNGTSVECVVGLDVQLAPWQRDSPSTVSAVFSGSLDAPGDRSANVTVVCDRTADKPVAAGPVVAVQNDGVAPNAWRYEIRLNSSAACGNAPTPPNPPPAPQAVCPAEVGTGTWALQQRALGSPSLDEVFNWYLSPCVATTSPDCPGLQPGFVVQWKPDQCIVSWTDQLVPWSVGSDENGARTLSAMFAGTFGVPNDRILNFTMRCNRTVGPGLSPDSPVIAQRATAYGPSAWSYTLTASTSVVCSGSPVPPPPSGAPNCPALPSVSLDISQEVPSNPALDQTYRWHFSVCQPSTVSTCPGDAASYVFEEDVSKSVCYGAFATQTVEWGRRYGGYNAAFVSTDGVRKANVTLVCDPHAATPIAAGNVIANPWNGQGWAYAIRLNTSIVC